MCGTYIQWDITQPKRFLEGGHDMAIYDLFCILQVISIIEYLNIETAQ